MLTTAVGWEMYMFPFGTGERAIVGFDVYAAEAKTHPTHLQGRRIVIFFAQAQLRPSGLPNAPESARIGTAEERFLSLLAERGTDAWLVGRLTVSGRRELVFQCDSAEGLERAFEDWHPTQTGVETQLLDGNGWTFFEEAVKPKTEHWVQIFDRRVIDELVKAGSDPRRMHLLEFTFRGLPPMLLPVKRILEEHKFRVGQHRPDTLIVREPSRLDLDKIWSISSEFRRLADGRGVMYEGWGAPIMPHTNPPISDDLLVYDEWGTPSVVLCPRCFSQLATRVTHCEVCSSDFEKPFTELNLDEHALELRVKCASCRQPMLQRASICPWCLTPAPTPIS